MIRKRDVHGGRSGRVLLWALLLSVGGLSGCFLVKPADVEIVGVEIASLGFTSGTADVMLAVTNESGGTMSIQGFLLELEVEDTEGDGGWRRLAEGFHSERLELRGGETREVVLRVPFEYAALGAAARSYLARGEVAYRVAGELWLGGDRVGIKVPFRRRGTLGS
jgi:hypothetical protein